MASYLGLDVSDKSTHLCAVDEAGKIVWQGRCATDPETLARTIRRHCRDVARVVLETGALSAFLYHGLSERGIPVVCVCARHAKGVLSTRVNKSDPHDAEGLSQLARTGWFKAIHVKDDATHLVRAELKVRDQLVRARRSLVNQMRGLLKLFGQRLGTVTTPAKRAERLAALFLQKPALQPALAPLVAAIEALESQIADMSRGLKQRAAADPVCARMMTIPSVGPILALTYKSSIEDPHRFARGKDAGAFAGLVSRRQQSGDRDTLGRISKAGDPMLRSALYEGANSLLARVKRSCPLQEWGKAIAATKGAKKARVAVARKLAVLLLTLWRSETDFQWPTAQAA
jgi:transposase